MKSLPAMSGALCRRWLVAVAALVLLDPLHAAVQPPCAGAEPTGVYHAYSTCLANSEGNEVWHIVTDAYYTCPGYSDARPFRVEELATDQPCDQRAPEISSRILPLEFGDINPDPAGEIVTSQCLNGFWHEVRYQRFRLPDGTIRIALPPRDLTNTYRPCDQPRPPLSLAADASSPQTPGQLVAAHPPSSAKFTLSGVVVAQREGEDGRSLLIKSPSSGNGKWVTGISLGLPKKTAIHARVVPQKDPQGRLYTKGGFTKEDTTDGIQLIGSPVRDRSELHIKILLEEGKIPTLIDVSILSEGEQLAGGSVPVVSLPPVTTRSDLTELLVLPSVLSPGEIIGFTPLDPNLTPRGGTWTIAGAAAKEIGDGSVLVDPPRYRVQMPNDLAPGSPISVEYTEPWGEPAVDVPTADDVNVIPPVSPRDSGPSEPALVAATPMTFAGAAACVCIEDLPSDRIFSLDGRSLSEVASASRVVQVQIPVDTPPGQHSITSDGAPQQLSLMIVEIGGEIDLQRMRTGGTTELRLWVTGTDDPVAIKVDNLNPDVATVAADLSAPVSTSGGNPNMWEATVHAGRPGDFNINYELPAAACPCADLDRQDRDDHHSNRNGDASEVMAMTAPSLPRIERLPPADDDPVDEPGDDDGLAETFERFRRGRASADRARLETLFGTDPGDLAEEALDELADARDALRDGIESGAIGPEAARAFREAIERAESGAREVVETLQPFRHADDLAEDALDRARNDDPAAHEIAEIALEELETVLENVIDPTRIPSIGPDLATSIHRRASARRDRLREILDPESDLDPRDEDDEVQRIGILLTRDDDLWIPENGNQTTVTAQIYERPAGSWIWTPSPSQRRTITIRFAERSNEPGVCLNDDGSRDLPDLYVSEEPESGCTPIHDTALGPHGDAIACRTIQQVNRFTFGIVSADFGSYGKLEATCPGCVQLTAIHPGDVRAVEVSGRERAFVSLPADENGNQIADGYLPDRLYDVRADDDTDAEPAGDGRAGDGLSAYEEYRGFMMRGSSHVRTDWKTKTLFVNNRSTVSMDLFTDETKGARLEVIEITRSGLDEDRVVNFSNHHAHLVDQHALIANTARGINSSLLGASIREVVDGESPGPGPPKNVDRIEIYLHNIGSSRSEDARVTMAHELGHSVGMRHHGEGGRPALQLWHPPGTDGEGLLVHNEPTICGFITLPDEVPFGTKYNQSSGAVDCIMRYPKWGFAFLQEDRSIDCVGQSPNLEFFCDDPAGTGFNANNRVAGDARCGDCRGQIIINDLHDPLPVTSVCGGDRS